VMQFRLELAFYYSWRENMKTANPDKIKTIVIVGGGTAGWLSALYLESKLNKLKERNCQITLIESPTIPILGIGEATIPTIVNTFKNLGISETEFMAKCNATFKLAIKFIDWSGVPKNNVFWHPIGQWYYTEKTDTKVLHYWLRNNLHERDKSCFSDCFETIKICENKKSPKLYDTPEFDWKLEYAYHFDAKLLANYLQEKAISLGVRHILDDVNYVSIDHRGYIDYLELNENGRVAGDLYIDCTGFRGLLINQALKVPFLSFSENLLCDSAVALSVHDDPEDPYNEKIDGIAPYTIARALTSGWMWTIPLVSRTSYGYVYSSSFLNESKAEFELKNVLNYNKTCDVKHLKLRVGRTKNSWEKNCISIGLSSGFIEPLESTGIYLIEAGLKHLLQYFPDKTFSETNIAIYNSLMKREYEEIRDFIVMHYCLTQREDTNFWRVNKYELKIPNSLQDKLDLWQARWPYNSPELVGLSFPDYSYICILAGMERYPQTSLPILEYDDTGRDKLLEIKRSAENLNQILPNLSSYLKFKNNQFFNMSSQGVSFV